MSATISVEGFHDPEQEFWRNAIGKRFAWSGMLNVPDAEHILVSAERMADGAWNCTLDDGQEVQVKIDWPTMEPVPPDKWYTVVPFNPDDL